MKEVEQHYLPAIEAGIEILALLVNTDYNRISGLGKYRGW